MEISFVAPEKYFFLVHNLEASRLYNSRIILYILFSQFIKDKIGILYSWGWRTKIWRCRRIRSKNIVQGPWVFSSYTPLLLIALHINQKKLKYLFNCTMPGSCWVSPPLLNFSRSSVPYCWCSHCHLDIVSILLCQRKTKKRGFILKKRKKKTHYESYYLCIKKFILKILL